MTHPPETEQCQAPHVKLCPPPGYRKCSRPRGHLGAHGTQADTWINREALTAISHERLTEALAPHRPIVDPQGRPVGCHCMDRVFVKGAEDYPSHLAAVLMGAPTE